MKKDDVADDVDDDVVRTSVSRDRVTAILCAEELLLSTQLSPHMKWVKCGRERLRKVNMMHLAVPAQGFL